MLTKREKEILEIIKYDPLISQEELASMLSISRSGVATHIHNLTRKGYIKGRGYVLKEPHFVSVVGGINMDIMGAPRKSLVINNSNPGTVKKTLGGAGRNIALNLTKLEIPNYFISVYGVDAYGSGFESDARKNDMNIDCCEKIPGAQTSTYMKIVDIETHESYSISDTTINDFITPNFISSYLDRINHSRYCIIDANLPQETIAYIFNEVQVPIVAKTVSVNKNEHLLQDLNKLFVLIATHAELDNLISIFNGKKDRVSMIHFLLDEGVKHIVLYSQTYGLDYYSFEERISINLEDIPSDNNTGTNAAITSVIVWGCLNNLSWKYIIQLCYAAIKVTQLVPESVNIDLSLDQLFDVHDALFIE